MSSPSHRCHLRPKLCITLLSAFSHTTLHWWASILNPRIHSYWLKLCQKLLPQDTRMTLVSVAKAGIILQCACSQAVAERDALWELVHLWPPAHQEA